MGYDGGMVTLDKIFSLREEIEEVGRENGIEFLGVFGSAARGEDRLDSDVDLLARFKSGVRIGFFEWARIEQRLSDKLGKKADLIIQDALKPRIKDRVYSDLKVIYGQP